MVTMLNFFTQQGLCGRLPHKSPFTFLENFPNTVQLCTRSVGTVPLVAWRVLDRGGSFWAPRW